MELYIIKSAACLSIFFAFYKLALENSSLHTSKRIYLIGALLVSFIIPFITFTSYVAMEPMTTAVFTSSPATTNIPTEVIAEKTNYIPYMLWAVYGLGVLFFGFKFSRNLFHIISKIKNNPSIKRAAFYDVLTSEQTAPHTFFNRLFFNKKAYEAKEFPQEVFWHEEAHAKQKHSADLLLIELLQVVFWFNPLCYLFKGAIKLNHEFLADREVLHKTEDTAQYQHILLSFSTPDHLRGQGLISFANSINYSSIKKRFTVMKTHTSKRAGLLKGLLIVPLLAVLVYGFSESKQEFITSEIAAESTLEDKILSLDISGANEIFNGDTKLMLTDLENLITTEAYTKSALQVDSGVNVPFAKSVVSELVRLDIAKKMTVCSSSDGTKVLSPENFKEIMSPLVERYNKNQNQFTLQVELSQLRLNGVPVKLADFAKTVDKVTKDWSATDYIAAHPNVYIASTPKSFLDKVEAEFTKTKFFKANGGIGIIPPPPPLPPGAPKVKMGEASNIPPPPPPPSNMGTIKNKYKYSYVLYVNGETIYLEGKKVSLSNFAKAMDTHTKDWPASAYKFYGVSAKRENVSEDFIKKLNTAYQKTKLAKKSSIKEPYILAPAALNLSVPPSPPPPGPEKPLDHVIAMAKRNATFHYENEKITSDKAINLLKENSDLNIQTRLNDPKPPMVYISKKGITVEDHK